jgi:hypothetical protein
MKKRPHILHLRKETLLRLSAQSSIPPPTQTDMSMDTSACTLSTAYTTSKAIGGCPAGALASEA